MNHLKEYLKVVSEEGVSLEDFVENWMNKLNETSLQIDAIMNVNYYSTERIINAIETIEEWAEYATPYMKEKHNLKKDKENVKIAISMVKAMQETNYRSQEKIIEQSKMIMDLRKEIEFLKNR